MCMRMSCVNGCVVALDWCLPRTFFMSGVPGAGVVMNVLCSCVPLVTEQYTKCSNGFFVLLKMGIMMPETC